MWGWLLERKDVTMDDAHGLTDGEIIKAFRASTILNTYRFKDEIVRQTATVEFPGRMGRGGQDLKFRGIYKRICDQLGETTK